MNLKYYDVDWSTFFAYENLDSETFLENLGRLFLTKREKQNNKQKHV